MKAPKIRPKTKRAILCADLSKSYRKIWQKMSDKEEIQYQSHKLNKKIKKQKNRRAL